MNQRGVKIPIRLTLAELEPFARTRLAVLFALSHAGIASETPFGAESAAQVGVSSEQRAGEAVTNSARLAIGSATRDGDLRVKFVSHPSNGQWLGGNHTQRFDREIVFKGAAVHDDLAGTC